MASEDFDRVLTRVRRFVRCGLLDVHVGDVETALVETERHRLTLHYLRCSRCGCVEALDVVPRHETEKLLDDGDREQFA